MSLKLTCIFHSPDYIFFRQIVFAEDIETVFVEVSVESRCHFAYLALDDALKRLGEFPVFVFQTSDVLAVMKTVAVA